VWVNEFVHAGSMDTGFTIRRVDADPTSEDVYQQHAAKGFADPVSRYPE
jgi:hypothetical protein